MVRNFSWKRAENEYLIYLLQTDQDAAAYIIGRERCKNLMNVIHTTYDRLTQMFNARFGTSYTSQQIRKRINNMKSKETRMIKLCNSIPDRPKEYTYPTVRLQPFDPPFENSGTEESDHFGMFGISRAADFAQSQLQVPKEDDESFSEDSHLYSEHLEVTPEVTEGMAEINPGSEDHRDLMEETDGSPQDADEDVKPEIKNIQIPEQQDSATPSKDSLVDKSSSAAEYSESDSAEHRQLTAEQSGSSSAEHHSEHRARPPGHLVEPRAPSAGGDSSRMSMWCGTPPMSSSPRQPSIKKRKVVDMADSVDRVDDYRNEFWKFSVQAAMELHKLNMKEAQLHNRAARDNLKAAQALKEANLMKRHSAAIDREIRRRQFADKFGADPPASIFQEVEQSFVSTEESISVEAEHQIKSETS